MCARATTNCKNASFLRVAIFSASVFFKCRMQKAGAIPVGADSRNQTSRLIFFVKYLFPTSVYSAFIHQSFEFHKQNSLKPTALLGQP